jgi:putative PEP-CTERM system TPR-repeat lipoprotein
MNAAQELLGEDPPAVAFLERSVATHPDNDDLKLSLAAAYLRSGQSAKAIEVLNRTTGQARLALAQVYLQEKQTRKADEVISQVIAAAPDRVDIVNLAGLLYLQTGRYDQALAHLRAAADRQPDNPGYWLNVVRAQLALNQTAAAREAVDKALALRADWPPAVAMAALLDLRTGHPDAALTRILELKEKHPRDAQVLLLEGEVRAVARQYAAAAEAFEAAGRLRPSAIAALKAFSARQMAGLADPTEPLRRWLEREPDDLVARAALADAYSPSDPAKAIEEYQQILQRAPKSAMALNNLAWLYHTVDDARALETARQAHQLAPSVPAISDTYGWILLQEGRVSEALPLLKAAAAAGDNPEIDGHYAEALKRSHAAAEAQRR